MYVLIEARDEENTPWQVIMPATGDEITDELTISLADMLGKNTREGYPTVVLGKEPDIDQRLLVRSCKGCQAEYGAEFAEISHSTECIEAQRKRGKRQTGARQAKRDAG
jgi:hypothetical protein